MAVIRRWLGLACLTLSLAALGACGKARPLQVGEGQGGGDGGTRAECTSCHGYPPNKDAHLSHAGLAASGESQPGYLGKSYGCEQCHKNVQRVNDPDHIVRANGERVPPPAEVRFDDPNALAAREGGARAGPPAFDRASRTCSNVYCHGATLAGQLPGLVTAPSWSDVGKGVAGCGNCHGIPPANAPHNASMRQTDCHRCHAPAIDAQGRVDPDLHLNGEVNTDAIQGAANCSACHGDPSAANVPPGDPRSAPPTDTSGRSTGPAVGAHQVHLRGGALAGPIACGECHVVPRAVNDPGHLDGAVQVVFGAVSRTGGAAPAYANGTCSNVYCHGAFNGGARAAPSWTAGAGGAACGSCHGIPPSSPPHPSIGTIGCGTCHAGYTNTTVNVARHANGAVDFQQ